MKRCTLFLSTAGGSSPYGTFTNITTDQTGGISRQIWHTYLNEQQGSCGCRRLSRRENLCGKYAAAPLLSKGTLCIYHPFHFCQGTKTHLLKVNDNNRAYIKKHIIYTFMCLVREKVQTSYVPHGYSHKYIIICKMPMTNYFPCMTWLKRWKISHSLYNTCSNRLLSMAFSTAPTLTPKKIA